MTIDFLSAFIIGLLGSGHCLGMCGGITSMLTSALPHQQAKPNALLIISYNVGRISSYAFIGALVGFTGSIAAKNIGFPITGLKLLAGIFLIFLGLYLGQWLLWLSKIEKAGKFIWQFISPLSKKVIPVNTARKALFLGAIWGWLPCGLVYSTLTWALASGDAMSGAIIMFFFGLGTLPALLTMSFGVLRIKTLLANQYFRKIMAITVILYGIYHVIIVAYPSLF